MSSCKDIEIRKFEFVERSAFMNSVVSLKFKIQNVKQASG